MGSSGHAFIAHTKALSPGAQAKDGGYGPPPHPRVIRLGQRYWPRAARRREVLTVRRITKEHALLERESSGEPRIRVALDRLLAVRPDDQGRHYQFHGFTARRYVTPACVWVLDGAQAVLCLPEWHPRRPVRLPLRLLPADAQHPGAWLRVRCNLSASSAGRLQVADLTSAPEPVPESISTPAVDLTPQRR